MLLADSPRLWAYTGGRDFSGDLPCLVFIHGAQLDHSVWAMQSRWFAHHGHAVLAIDLPGHGLSEGPLASSVEALAEALAAPIARTTPQPLLIVGHSLGSLIALELARRLPRQTAGVALLGTAFPMKVSPALLEASLANPQEAIESIDVWSHSPGVSAFNRRPSAPGPGFSIPGQSRRLMMWTARRHGPEVLPTDFAACNAYEGGLQAAASLTCPALFVLGEADLMTPPRAAQGLIEACRQARVARIAGAGHEMMSEASSATLAALRDFSRHAFSQFSTLEV